MRHTNNVYLSGRITSARSYDGGQFGFLNITMCHSQVPVAVKFGGKSYSGSHLNALAERAKNNPAVFAIVGGGYVQERKNGGWEVSVADGDFMLYDYEVPDVSFAQLRGKVLSISPDQENVPWAEIAQSYWSKNPSSGDKGQWKERNVRVRLDRMWDQSVVGRKMGVTGSLNGMIGEQKVLHIVTDLSYIFE